MFVRRLLSGRGVLAASLAATMVLTLSGTVLGAVPPEQTNGAVGVFNLRESSSLPAPYCIYPFGDPGTKVPLAYFHVRPPLVWAHDDGDANHHESQTVGYQLIIQRATHPATGPWATVVTGNVFKKTAFEDQSAKFHPRDITYHAGSGHTYARLIVKLTWYSGTSVVGSVRHWYSWYSKTVSSGINPDWSTNFGTSVYGRCPSHMTL
jgi:hypothetical protein